MSSDDHDLAYIDYIAEHKSGFLCDDPPDVIGEEEMLARMVEEVGGRVYRVTEQGTRRVHATHVNHRIQRRRR